MHLEDTPYIRLVDPKLFAFRLFDDRQCKPSVFDIVSRQRAKIVERSWNEAIVSIICSKRLSYLDPPEAADYIGEKLRQYCARTMQVYKPIITIFTKECDPDSLEGKAGVTIYGVDAICPTAPRLGCKTYFDKHRINSVVERYYAMRGFHYIEYFVKKYNQVNMDLLRLLSFRITVK